MFTCFTVINKQVINKKAYNWLAGLLALFCNNHLMDDVCPNPVTERTKKHENLMSTVQRLENYGEHWPLTPSREILMHLTLVCSYPISFKLQSWHLSGLFPQEFYPSNPMQTINIHLSTYLAYKIKCFFHFCCNWRFCATMPCHWINTFSSMGWERMDSDGGVLVLVPPISLSFNTVPWRKKCTIARQNQSCSGLQ